MKIELLTTVEAAEYLNVSHRTLEKWRADEKCGLGWFKYKGVVRYHKKELDAFIERRTRGKKNGKIQED